MEIELFIHPKIWIADASTRFFLFLLKARVTVMNIEVATPAASPLATAIVLASGLAKEIQN